MPLVFHKHYTNRPYTHDIGKGYAEEEVINENTYRVTMTLTHAVFGEMYRYEGGFTFTRTTI